MRERVADAIRSEVAKTEERMRAEAQLRERQFEQCLNRNRLELKQECDCRLDAEDLLERSDAGAELLARMRKLEAVAEAAHEFRLFNKQRVDSVFLAVLLLPLLWLCVGFGLMLLFC